MNYNINSIGFVYTYKCNALCEHCCFSCTMNREEKIEFERAKEILEEAADIGIQAIAFSGGEIFLFYDELVELLLLCKKHKMRASCTTNGFWGMDCSDAERKMKKLKLLGIEKMIVSVDKFHQAYIDIESVKNIIHISHKLGFNLIINSTIINSEMNNISQGLGADSLDIMVERDRCLRIGRAEKLIEEGEFVKQEIWAKKCFMLTKKLCIYPNGQVYPCCSPYSYGNSNLLLGCIYEMSLRDCIQNMQCNKNIYKKYKYGFNEDLRFQNTFLSLCDICALDKNTNL